MTSTRLRGGRVSRRDLLATVGGVGMGLALLGCEVVTDPNAADGGRPSPSPSRLYNIPDSGAKIPTEKVTFQWMGQR